MDTESQVVFSDAARKVQITTAEADLGGKKYAVSEILNVDVGSDLKRMSGCGPIVWLGAAAVLLLATAVFPPAILGVGLCAYLTYATLKERNEPTTTYFVEVTTSLGTFQAFETEDMTLARAVSQAIQDARMRRTKNLT